MKDMMPKGPITLGDAPPQPQAGSGAMKTPADMAAETGLPLNPGDRAYSPRLAQELTRWAASKGPWFDFFHAVYVACYAEGKNISDISVLCDIAESVGLPGEEAKEALETRAYKAAVDEDWEESRQHGISAIPAFIMGGAKLVNGAATYEEIAAFMDKNGVQKRV